MTAGCTSVVDGVLVHADDAYEQAITAFGVGIDALERAGCPREKIISSRMYIVDRDNAGAVGRAHSEVFDKIRPTSAMIVVAGFVDPRMLVEIELTGYRHDGCGAGDSLPGRRQRTRGEGRQLPRAARRRRPGRAGPQVRRGRRGRVDLPRHHRLLGRSRDDLRRRPADGRAGLHPADRRRWCADHGRCRCVAAGRCRQGGREHRGHRPARVDPRDLRAFRQPGPGAVGRRPTRACRVPSRPPAASR